MLNPFRTNLLVKPRLSSTVYWFLCDPVKVPELSQFPPISLKSCRIGHESLGLSCSPTGPNLFVVVPLGVHSHHLSIHATSPIAHHSRILHPSPVRGSPHYLCCCRSSFRRPASASSSAATAASTAPPPSAAVSFLPDPSPPGPSTGRGTISTCRGGLCHF